MYGNGIILLNIIVSLLFTCTPTWFYHQVHWISRVKCVYMRALSIQQNTHTPGKWFTKMHVHEWCDGTEQNNAYFIEKVYVKSHPKLLCLVSLCYFKYGTMCWAHCVISIPVQLQLMWFLMLSLDRLFFHFYLHFGVCTQAANIVWNPLSLILFHSFIPICVSWMLFFGCNFNRSSTLYKCVTFILLSTIAETCDKSFGILVFVVIAVKWAQNGAHSAIIALWKSLNGDGLKSMPM